MSGGNGEAGGSGGWWAAAAGRALQAQLYTAKRLLACRDGGGQAGQLVVRRRCRCVALRGLEGCSTVGQVSEEASKALRAGEAPLPAVAASQPPAAQSANGSVLYCFATHFDWYMPAHPSTPNSYIIGIAGKRANATKGRAGQAEVVEAPCMLNGSILF